MINKKQKKYIVRGKYKAFKGFYVPKKTVVGLTKNKKHVIINGKSD